MQDDYVQSFHVKIMFFIYTRTLVVFFWWRSHV